MMQAERPVRVATPSSTPSRWAGLPGGGVYLPRRNLTRSAFLRMKSAPQLQTIERARPDVGDEQARPVELRRFERPAVLGLDGKETGEAALGEELAQRLRLCRPHLKRLAALLEQRNDIIGRQHRQQREPRLEAGVLLGRTAEELAQPVDEFEASGIGDAVDRALRAVTVPRGLLLGDERVLLQRLHHCIERPVVELDALVLVPLAH